MSKTKEVQTTDQISKFLSDKDNKKYHYNFHNAEDYKISSGSLNLDIALGGGLPSGAHRFTGINEGGKTSCAMTFAKNFQKHFGKKGMIIYVKSEGRMSKEMIERMGIDTDPQKFFVFDCNIFEKVFELIRELVFENEDDKRYMFIIDSVDALCRVGDISQVRVEVATNPYAARGGPKQKQAGGNAIKHYANFILEFEERYTSDLIFKNPTATKLEEKGRPIGHYCKIKFRKSINERTGSTARYPIKYGEKDGKSVWRAREILDMLYLFNLIEKKGAWISVSEDLISEIKSKKLEINDKFQGELRLIEFLEDNVELSDFLYEDFKKLTNAL